MQGTANDKNHGRSWPGLAGLVLGLILGTPVLDCTAQAPSLGSVPAGTPARVMPSLSGAADGPIGLVVSPGSAVADPLQTPAVEPVPGVPDARIQQVYGRLPMHFEPNLGQAAGEVRYLARGAGYSLFLTDTEAVLVLRKGRAAGPAGEPETAGSVGADARPHALGGKLALSGPFSPLEGHPGSKPVSASGAYPLLKPSPLAGDGWGRKTERLPYGEPPYSPVTNAGPHGSHPSRHQIHDRLAASAPGEPPQAAVVRMRLEGTTRNPAPAVSGLERQPGISNYYLGNDPAKWHSGVPHYARVQYDQVYPGIDLVFYGNPRQLEYDLVVAPGADPGQIRLSFEGVDGMRIDGEGNLVLAVAGGEIVQKAPRIYQRVDGQERVVAGRYVALNEDEVRAAAADATAGRSSMSVLAFQLASYDVARPLVIDPVLLYSTYLGGDFPEAGAAVAVDGAGNAYITGYTASADFPTVNARYPVPGSYVDVDGNSVFRNAFVTKLDAQGQGLIYSTYLGGSLVDRGTGIAVDGAGNAYITGFTASADFPTVNARYPVPGSYVDVDGNSVFYNAFVTKLDARGQGPSYSTYLGGRMYDEGTGIAVDGAGNAYVTGVTYSNNFPTVNARYPVPGSYVDVDGNSVFHNAFVTKLDARGQGPIYSTYLGGRLGDKGTGIAVDGAGNAYVTGVTYSNNFPTLNARYPVPGSYAVDGNSVFHNAFVTKFDARGQGPIYSTYLGGRLGDEGTGIAVDGAGNAYVTGVTYSNNFPMANARYPVPGSYVVDGNSVFHNAFVTKFDARGQGPIYSTYLGGRLADGGTGIAVDAAGNAYITGYTGSGDFPVANALFHALHKVTCGNPEFPEFPCVDAFVTVLDASGQGPAYSTYLGGDFGEVGAGIAVDWAGKAYVTAYTASADFPVTNALFPALHKDTCGNPDVPDFLCVDAFITAFPSIQEFPKLEKNLGCSDGPGALCGNPINATTGNKLQVETDFIAAPQTGLTLVRYYNSQDVTDSVFGSHWRSAWHRGLISRGNIVFITRADGRQDTFALNGSTWLADPDVTSRLTGSAASGWTLTSDDDTQERYNTNGLLISITTRAGLVTTLAYDGSSRLTTVTGPFGHTLRFAYTASGQVGTMTAPDGQVYTYAYDAQGNLASVTYPDRAVRRYLYEDSNFPNALTGILDENGSRFATYAYDDRGRAVSTEHAGGVELTTVAYNTDGTASVTDPRGNLHGYNFSILFGLVKPTAVTGAPVQSSGGKSFAYNGNGFIASRTDFNGNLTTYTHNIRGLETSRTEASGTPLARTVQTDWHPSFHLPTRIVEPNRITTLAYDTRGNLLKKTITAGGSTRTWGYTYNARGQVLSIDGPRTDLTDVTRFSYDAKGNLATLTDALGHVTRFTSYDAAGRPLTTQDPNGMVTSLTYDARGRIKTRTEGTETTTLDYDLVGNPTKVTRPDGSFLTLGYDAAHRLTEVRDALGNRLVYTLDAAGNRTLEKTLDLAGNQTRTRAYAYDEVNRLLREIGAQGQTTVLDYDEDGNLTGSTDPLGAVTEHTYDALNRLIETLDPNAGTTAYGFDANDHLTSVADPRGLTTSYAWSGLDNPVSVTSPDTGTTTRTFDAAGNIITSTDAKGQRTTYGWDALNRKVRETYADGRTITWQYDQGTNGIGHLTTLVDPTGTTGWTYDAHGRVLTRRQVTGTVTLTTGYSYDSTGRLARLTHPSGKVLTLRYDGAGRLNAIDADGEALLSQVSYPPFGQANAWTQGNGAEYRRTLDLDGRIVGIDSGSASPTAIEFDHDAASRILAMTETGVASKDFAYDPLGQLTSYTIGADTTAFVYDPNGNRLQAVTPAGTTNYSYSATSNRLSGLSGLIPDTKGLMNGAYTYDTRGRLAQATVGGATTTYGINGLGQRVSKRGASSSLIFVYDESGHLLGEYDAAGQPIRETVWLDDTPVGVLTGTGSAASAYYINPNHLDAPHTITDKNGRLVWTWDPLAFGDNPANENPAGLGTFVYNLRFPGQYYDAETGLHYNYFRDYHPAIGRYVQSDPVGLKAGNNTYAYVGGNPANLIDPKGECVALLQLTAGVMVVVIVTEQIILPIVGAIQQLGQMDELDHKCSLILGCRDEQQEGGKQCSIQTRRPCHFIGERSESQTPAFDLYDEMRFGGPYDADEETLFYPEVKIEPSRHYGFSSPRIISPTRAR